MFYNYINGATVIYIEKLTLLIKIKPVFEIDSSLSMELF